MSLLSRYETIRGLYIQLLDHNSSTLRASAQRSKVAKQVADTIKKQRLISKAMASVRGSLKMSHKRRH